MDEIRGVVNYYSEVNLGKTYEGQRVAELRFSCNGDTTVVVIDTATAAKLIRQLRKVLDDDYNRAINERDQEMKFKVVVYLKDGSSVKGKVSEIDQVDLEAFKEGLKDVMKSTPEEGWQINVESEDSSWAIFPKDSILWVELERVKD